MGFGEQLISNIIAIAVLAGFGYLIYAKMQKKNPELAERMGSWFKPKQINPEMDEVKVHINKYPEKRLAI